MKQRSFLIGATLVAAIALTACDDIRVEEFPDGKIRMETSYVDDKKQGIEKEYYNNGTLRRETNYNADRKDGLQKEYYDDGTLQAETPFADGYIEGEVTKYHKNGKVASKAKYQKNKQVEFGEVYDPDGTPATDGSYKDPRDGYAYQWIRIGTQLWTAENMNFGTYEGSVCAQCNHWGRLYNFENAKKACLDGFHMPTKEEWKTLLTFAETSGKVGTVLKAGYGWDPITEGGNDYGNGKDELGFGVKAGGAHMAKSDVPLKERKFEDAGKKAYLWTAEGEVLVFYHDKDIAKFEKFNPEFGASLRCLKD